MGLTDGGVPVVTLSTVACLFSVLQASRTVRQTACCFHSEYDTQDRGAGRASDLRTRRMAVSIPRFAHLCDRVCRWAGSPLMQ